MHSTCQQYICVFHMILTVHNRYFAYKALAYCSSAITLCSVRVTNWIFTISSAGFSLQRRSGDTVDNPLRLYAVWFVVTAKFRATVWIWVDIKGNIFDLIGAPFINLPGIREATKVRDSRVPFEIRRAFLQNTCIALPLRCCSEMFISFGR